MLGSAVPSPGGLTEADAGERRCVAIKDRIRLSRRASETRLCSTDDNPRRSKDCSGPQLLELFKQKSRQAKTAPGTNGPIAVSPTRSNYDPRIGNEAKRNN